MKTLLVTVDRNDTEADCSAVKLSAWETRAVVEDKDIPESVHGWGRVIPIREAATC
jgi:hypothetical protein